MVVFLFLWGSVCGHSEVTDRRVVGIGSVGCTVCGVKR